MRKERQAGTSSRETDGWNKLGKLNMRQMEKRTKMIKLKRRHTCANSHKCVEPKEDKDQQRGNEF